VPINVKKNDAHLVVQSLTDTQKLVWVVDIEGTSNDNQLRGGELIIDANSGEISMVNPFI
jgi:uncharacterized secreted protein with C-terminal beta-propeller domain